MKTSPWPVALSGSAALAVAMGIGRFAFTPILPMMQEDAGLSLSEGAWLACANYLGYLLGALAAIRCWVGERSSIRFGLVVVALTTLGMAFTESFVIWLFLRGVAGFASAWILVYASTWSLERLGKAGRDDLSGTVYAGVGAGMVFAGLACLALSQVDADARRAWLVLGLGAAALLSTLVAAQFTRYVSNRGVWILANLIMALGVLLPVAVSGLTGIVISALCVGSTFMITTMMGLREAKRVAGVQAQLLIAAMTSAFAAGQIIGPLLVGGPMKLRDGFTVALVIAALPLLFAAYALVNRGTMGAPRVVPPSITPRNSS